MLTSGRIVGFNFEQRNGASEGTLVLRNQTINSDIQHAFISWVHRYNHTYPLMIQRMIYIYNGFFDFNKLLIFGLPYFWATVHVLGGRSRFYSAEF